MDKDDPVVLHARQYMLTTFIIISSALMWWFWTAIIAANSQLIHGYPLIATPSGPGVFVSTRGTIYTVMVCIIPINYVLLLVFAFMMANPSVQEIAWFYTILAQIVIIIDILLLIWFLASWGLVCYSSWGDYNTICQDPRACCSYYGDWTNMCPNVDKCNPDYTSSQNSISGPAIGHLVITAASLIAAGIQSSFTHFLKQNSVLTSS